MKNATGAGIGRLLRGLLIGGLAWTGISFMGVASAQMDAPASQSGAQKLDEIVVTGSRIKRNQLEGPSQVTIITAEQIQREGYVTVYDALNALTVNTAAIQNNMAAGSFTQNANYVELLNLGPGRTLILLDGRRTTDYPLPYNGQSNMVNLNTIPMEIVEKIEILSGGASAIYGSDAVAGVINIILKKEVNEGFASVTYGDTTEGGGDSLQFNLGGGKRFGGLQVTYALEHLDRKPIWAYERDVIDSNLDNPVAELQGRYTLNAVLLDYFDIDGDGYESIDPRTVVGANACENIPSLQLAFRDDPARGYFCGRQDDASQFTIRNASRNTSGYIRLSYDLSDGLNAWGSLNAWQSKSWYNAGTPFWSASDPYFDPNVGSLIYASQRILTFEEIGGNLNDEKFDEQLLDFAAGINGQLSVMERSWSWELTFSMQQYELENKVQRMLNDEVEDYFIGDPGPDPDPIFGAFPVYTTNMANFFGPLSRSTWDALTETDDTDAESSNKIVNFVVSGDLFSLPGGNVGMAAILEYGTQDYEISLDPLVSTVAGDYTGGFYGITGTAGGGERDRFAAGLELSIPIIEQITVSLAGRYDKYDDITEVDDALTYRAGLELRPLDSLLIRGAYATSFRAPDMHFVFAGESGFFTDVTDYYKCRQYEPDEPYIDCTYGAENIAGQRSGNPALEEEEGKSYTAGIVWDATKHLQFQFEYFDIELENIVNDLSISNLLETEADCRLGQTEGGVPVDVNSAECADAIARITRRPADPGNDTLNEQILSVSIGAINRSLQRVKGFNNSLAYRRPTASWGTFGLAWYWTHILSDRQAQFEEDPVIDERDNLQNFNFRSRTSLAVFWENDTWAAAVKALRLGSTPNWAETARVNPWTTINATVGYQATRNLGFLLTVNNVLNEMPPRDPTYDVYPYFSTYNYNPYGREFFLRAEYKLY